MTITDELIRHVAGEPHERQRRFAQNRAIYEADMDAPLQGDTAKLDNVIVPGARNIIDAGVRFLFGGDITFDVTEAYGEDAQTNLRRLWFDVNRMPTKLLELGLHGGITGAFCFKFEPDTTDERDGDHRWVVADPSYLDVMWDPHDTETVLLYRFEYPTVEPDRDGKLVPFVWRQDIEAVRSEPDAYGRRTIVSWTITNSRAKAPTNTGDTSRRWFARSVISSPWERVGDVHPWPYPWAPVFAGQNQVSPNSWWGYSDIEPGVVRLLNSLNRVASNIAKTIRHFAHPVTVVRGGTIPDDHAIGEPIELPGAPDEVDIANLEMQSDMSPALEFMDTLRGEVYDAGNTPDVARGKLDKVGQMSGVAMRLHFGPLLGVTEQKHRTYGDQLEKALRCALEYMGFKPQQDADAGVQLVWPDPLPKNEKEDAEVAEIDQRLGASKRTTLERRGYDPDVEFDSATEEGAVDPGMRGVLDLVGTQQEPAQVAQDASVTTDASVPGEV